MKKFLNEISNNILSLNRYSKRAIVITFDIILCIFCTWIAFVLRFESLIQFKDINYLPSILSIVLFIPIFWMFGLYRTIFRFNVFSIILNISTSIIVYSLLYFSVIAIYGINGVPRSIGIIQPVLLFFIVICSRLIMKYILVDNYYLKNSSTKKNVLVYGAGDAGRQLVSGLENNSKFEVVGFLDDNKQLHRQNLLSKTIYSPLKLEKLIKKKNVNSIFLALPSVSRKKKNQIIDYLIKFNINVRSLPSLSEIIDGKVTSSDVEDLKVEDLLNRNEIEPDINLINKNIKSKIVLVTGAGGSIGSELCKQIAKLNPEKLILLEINEFALFKINEELKVLNKNLKIIPLLLNLLDKEKLNKIFNIFKVETVYHTAAYKHVTLVEENVCEGVKNNIFSTLAVINASIKNKISNLVFISSDKAVRPTNVMGATKRLAEMCMQAIYNRDKNIKTRFAIVRFGNVLESSGSAIPKFKKQIKEGGPVTLTDEKVTRYFMTVREAAQLVLQAGAMGHQSEVFILEMGESIKIKNLIEKMIKLSGHMLKDEKNPNGDIEIKIIGLRPGEKLHEELLIGKNPKKTNHPKIKKIKETFIPYEQLEIELNKLKNLLLNNEPNKIKNLLSSIIKNYHSNSKTTDKIYEEVVLSRQINKNLTLNNNIENNVVKLEKL